MMTEVIRKTETKEEAGTLVPLFPALPRWAERLDELFDRWPLHPLLRFPEELAPRFPPVDVYEDGGAVVVKAELPGMKKEEIEVELLADVLTISGRKAREEKVEQIGRASCRERV